MFVCSVHIINDTFEEFELNVTNNMIVKTKQ